MTREAILRAGINAGGGRGGRAQQSRGASSIVLRMARRASVHGDGWVRSNVSSAAYLVGSDSVNAAAPAAEQIRLPRNDAVRIMARQAELTIRTVAHQKILGDGIYRLRMRIMTAGALHIAVDELYRLIWIRGRSLSHNRGGEIWGIFDGQNQAERMRATQIGAQHILIVHRSIHGNFAVHRGLTDGHGSVVAAEAQAAGFAHDQLRIALLLVSGAGVRSVSLRGQRLIPQRRDSAKSTVGRVAKRAAQAALCAY